MIGDLGGGGGISAVEVRNSVYSGNSYDTIARLQFLCYKLVK